MRARTHPAEVEILEAHHDAPAVVARQRPIHQESSRVSDVQRSRRSGREAGDTGGGHRGRIRSVGGDFIHYTSSMSIVKLTDADIAARLQTLPEWSQPGEEIQRTFRFKDFVAAMAFVDRIAERAESVQHHPDILIRYSRVTLSLSTHDAGGISDKDFEFAAASDLIGAECAAR